VRLYKYSVSNRLFTVQSLRSFHLVPFGLFCQLSAFRTQLMCVTVAQVRTGHSPLVTAYLHHIGRRDSDICPHCHSADETVEHLVFQCPANDHARRDTWPGDTFTTDPRRLWSYLERIGAVTRPLTGNERERVNK